MKELMNRIHEALGDAPESIRGRISETRILNDEEVSYLARATRLMLEHEGLPVPGKGFEDSIRFRSAAAMITRRRERMGVSIAEAAKSLKIPQYRLKDIEESSMKHIRPEFLKAYVEFLGIRTWLGRWAKQNRELATRLGLVTAKGERR